MLKNDEFINNVWHNYNKYSQGKNKDKFFQKHVYKNTDYTSKMKMISTLMATILVMATGVYAGLSTYNNTKNEVQQNHSNMIMDIEVSDNFDWAKDLDMKYDADSYCLLYKKITNYEQYTEIKKLWNSIIEMTEEDFNENFVLILMAPDSTYISDIYCEDQTTVIEISRNSVGEEETGKNLISTKISNILSRENIDIRINPNLSEMESRIELNNITAEYTKEIAIADGCFVIENYKIVSPNKNQMDEFIEKINNDINSSIRVVDYNIKNNFMYVEDIVYKDGICEVSHYNIDDKTTYFGRGNQILKSRDELKKTYCYFLVDKGEWEKYGVDEMHLFHILFE